KKDHSLKQKIDLECFECEYRSRSVNAWQAHLRRKHSTTPNLAGCILRCECGTETVSFDHSQKCEISNTTVIRNGNKPIRRLTDLAVADVPCVYPQCEAYPKTAIAYVKHLYDHHKSTLTANGVYLKCSCGLKVRHATHYVHHKECDGRTYTMHRLDGE
ncbi:hypothetical protein PMAYCL1PPCAC_13544, partial [Pristionchus mayeri]